MARAEGFCGVQVLMSLLHCMQSLHMDEGLFTFVPLSEEFGNVDKIWVKLGVGTKSVEGNGFFIP